MGILDAVGLIVTHRPDIVLLQSQDQAVGKAPILSVCNAYGPWSPYTAQICREAVDAEKPARSPQSGIEQRTDGSVVGAEHLVDASAALRGCELPIPRHLGSGAFFGNGLRARERPATIDDEARVGAEHQGGIQQLGQYPSDGGGPRNSGWRPFNGSPRIAKPSPSWTE